MNTTKRTTVFGVNKRIAKVVHNIMLFGMLHSTFVAPAQIILLDYFHASEPPVTKWGTYLETQENVLDVRNISDNEGAALPSDKSVTRINKVAEVKTEQVYYSDIEQGLIGVFSDKPLDDAKDNLFKLNILNIPRNAKGYLKYDLYGVEGVSSVSRSINDLPSTGGHIIKKNNAWSSQVEEIDINWLKEGENTILFTAPSLKEFGYKVKNLRVEFAENIGFNSSMVLNIDETTLLKKDNKIYVKGFINNAKKELLVEVEGIPLSVYQNQFEGVVELSDNMLHKKHLLIVARDNNGVLGQEVISLINLIEADLFVPFEVNSNVSLKTFNAFRGSEFYIEGAGIIVPDSALVERKNISISKLRKKDIAPLNSGMINVTKDGAAFRFLPDGTKFQKEAKILLEYDLKLIPSGYSEKDIKTFYFNTKSKSWVSVERDSVDLPNRTIISNTDHFTDYINGIIQTPETPETSAFIPTMMSDIKAADPSAGITLISPPEVSQKGSAGISYPIKVPVGRNGMQPSLAIQYNSDGGNGFLGQGWDISIPAITIDTRWGVPVLDDEYETEIYILNGEQLMYPKIETENPENEYEDWMPNRHYIDGLDENNDPIYNTSPRDRLPESEAVFTPRKQGSFVKIERKGNSPATYYWKVTGTDGTISWYGGKTAVVDDYVLKNTDNKVVHWSLYMVEDVFGNNIKYEYVKENVSVNPPNINTNLNGGTFYRISTIKYTGHNGADGGYSVVFNVDDGDYRDDVTIDSRLGVKLVVPRLLSGIEVKRETELIRKYNLFYGAGKFGKSRLEAVAEANGSNQEFYRHEFDYYDDLKDEQGNDVYFSSGVDIDTCDEGDGGDGEVKCYTVSFPVPSFSSYNYKGALQLNKSITISQNIEQLYFSVLMRNFQIGGNIPIQSFFFSRCGQGGEQNFDNVITFSEYENYSYSNMYYGNTNSQVQNDSEYVFNLIFNSNPDMFSVPGMNVTPYEKKGSDFYNEVLDNYTGRGSTDITYSSISPSLSGTYEAVYLDYWGNEIMTPYQIVSILPTQQINYIPVYAYINESPIYDSNYIYFTSGLGGDNGFNTFKTHILSTYPNAQVTYLQGIITIKIDNTTQILNSISITSADNQFSQSYPFIEVPCYQNKNAQQDMFSSHDSWKDYKPSKEEMHFLNIRNIAEGNNLDLPFTDELLMYDIFIDEKQIVTNLSSGVYYWCKINDDEFWKNEKGDLIFEESTINELKKLLPTNIKEVYYELKKKRQIEETEHRLVAQKEAQEWIKNNNLYKDIEEANKLVVFQKEQADLNKPKTDDVNSNEDNLNSKFLKRFGDFNNNLQSNFSYTFESLFGDPDCPSMVNAEFLIDGLIPSFNSYLSPLGSSSTTSIGAGGYLGILGVQCNFLSKNTTFGLGFGASGNWSKSKRSMIDINGDGLSDIVIHDNNNLYYQPHTVQIEYDENGEKQISHSFGPIKPIGGINSFYNAVGISWQFNFSINSYLNIGYEQSESKTTTEIYFTDANGDGLIDIVKNGVVYFNRLDNNGDPYFEKDSKTTENMVIVAEPMSVEEPVEEPEFVLPAYDVVKVWEAPVDGTIEIDNFIELTDLSKEATVTIEIKPISGTENPGCSECTDCELCPDCPDCNENNPDPCFMVSRLPEPVKGTFVYLDGVMVQGGPFSNYNEIVIALNAQFPGEFVYTYINGVHTIYYYNPDQTPVTLTLNLDGPVSTHNFEPCPPGEQQGMGTNSNASMMQTTSSSVQDCLDTGDLCLLFGANLNNINTEVNTLITTFSEHCGGGGTQKLTVKKGERIYFRVHSVENGNPPINWNPKITYLNTALTGVTDQNGILLYDSSYSDGFILSQDIPFTFRSMNGGANVVWDTFTVSNPSDKVTFKIIERKVNIASEEVESESVIWEKACEPNMITDIEASSLNFNVSETDNIVQWSFVIESTSNVRWKDYPWKPSITTTIVEDVTIDELGTSEGTLTSIETHYPIVNYSVYKPFTCGPVYTTFDISTVNGGNALTIKPQIPSGTFSSEDKGVINFVVKNNGDFVGRRVLTINGNNVSYDDNSDISLQNITGHIEIGYYVGLDENKTGLVSKLASASSSIARINYPGGNHNIPNSKVNLYHKSEYFGPMYRQWGQFFYNSDKAAGGTPTELFGDLINEYYLFQSNNMTDTEIENLQDTLNSLNGEQIINNDDIAAIEAIESQYDSYIQDGSVFLSGLAHREVGMEDRWVGFHKENYVTETAFRAATLTQMLPPDYEVQPYNFQDMLDTGAYGINKVFKSKGKNLSGGGSYGSISGSITKSLEGSGKIVTDYVDLNGDRYPDVVSTEKVQFTTPTGGLKAPINRLSNESVITINRNSSYGAGVSGGFGGSNDKQGSKDSTPKTITAITNTTKSNTSTSISGNFSEGTNYTDSFWMDVNGDGIPDLIAKVPLQGIRVFINKGGKLETSYSSWQNLTDVFESKAINVGGGVGFSVWNSSIQGGASISASWNNTKHTFVDLNGDGLVDIVDTEDNLKVKINRGNRFWNMGTWSSFNLNSESVSVTGSGNGAGTYSPVIPIPILGTCIKIGSFSGNANISTSTNKTEKMITDFDGDGFPDLIEKINEGVIRVYHSRIRRTDKLKSVTNPLGGKFTVDYKVHTVDYDNPNPKWVMSSVEIEDGYDGLIDDGHNTYKKQFVYENPRYDRRERDFYGFETVKTIDYTLDEEGEQDEVYRTSVTKYHNRSYFLNGLVKETTVYKGDMDNNELYSKSENIYEIRRLGDDNQTVDTTPQGILPEDYDVGGSEGRRSAIVLLSKTKNYVYELGNSPLVSESTMTYDEKGRVERFDYLGAPNNQQDNYSTEIGYHNISTLTDKNIITVPFRIVVSVNGQVKRLRETHNIDPSTGTIGMIRHFYTSNEFAQVDLEYDQYGNIVKVEYPENENSERMSYTYEYDIAYNKHVTKVTDAFGYSSETEYDFKFDVPLEVTDIAGNKTRYTYDTFGRMTEVLGPKEMQASQPYTIQFEYFPKYSDIQALGVVSQNEFVPVALTKHYDTQHPTNDIDTYTFIDGLARPVQVKKDITINSNTDPLANPTYVERMSVSGAVIYDEFGRAVKQYHPIVEDKLNTVNFKYNPTQAAYFIQSIYDPLDRVVETIDEEGSQAFMDYSVEDGLHKTRSVVQQNSSVDIISESFKDVNGRVVKTNNVGPQGDIITLFDYNAIGELLSYTDDMGMSTSYKYDLLGRKSEMTHPDRGTTKYYYDKASNLTRLQTANLIAQGQYISYHYEYNRLKGIIFPEMAPGVDNLSNVLYEYGIPSSGNQTGRLIFQQDASGIQEFEYGNMGELIYNKRTVVAPSPTLPTRTFETHFEYDSWNRLQEMTYPDGETVRYSYDLGGNLNEIQGDMPYVRRIDYNHYGERTYIKYGNETETIYSYTPTLRRLDNLRVLASNNETLLNNSYEYDKVGNVENITNLAGFNQVNFMGGGYQHSYRYDNLNRLVYARGGFTGHPMQYELGNDYSSDYETSMVYNSTHGIVNKTQTHNKNGQGFLPNTYANDYIYYDGTHRVKQITNANTSFSEGFDYDLNGNIVYRYNDETGTPKYYFWDEADRLRVIDQKEGLLHHYVYDASGQRVLKASSEIESVYENGQLVDSNIQMGNYTSYPSAFLVVDPDGIYSKHYYAGTQRIAARMGQHNADELFEDKKKTAKLNGTDSTDNTFNPEELKTLQQKDLQLYLDKAGKVARLSFKKYKSGESEVQEQQQENENNYVAYGAMAEELIYYYHPDHLGTATYLTDINGEAYEFFLNLPFGETMAEQHSMTTDYQNRWKFTGHELDRETGLYYAGARYYDPRTSIWLSVDPLAEQAPDWTPYRYGFNNPIRYTDPTGMWEDIIDINIDTGDIQIIEADGDDVVRFKNKDNQVTESYTYGEKGSFSKDFDLQKGNLKVKTIDGTIKRKYNVLSTTNIDKANDLFNRIADASNIEFEKLIYNKGGHRVADIATTGDESTTYYGVTFADNHVKNGFIVESWDHNHPGGTPPSGHNRKTGLPIEDIFGRFFGDADFARHKKESGNYDNTQFFVTPKCQNIKYQFDGKNQYKKISR